MRKLIIALSIAGLFASGCASIPSLGTVPAPTVPAPTTSTPQLVTALFSMVCASPVAKTDPQVSAACLVYSALGAK